MSVLQTLAGRPLVRRAADAILAGRAAAGPRLDACNVGRVQRHTLLSLVKRAEHTRFGRLHDAPTSAPTDDYQARSAARRRGLLGRVPEDEELPHSRDAACRARLSLPPPILPPPHTRTHTQIQPRLARNARLQPPRRAETLGFYQSHYRDLALFRGRLFFLGGSTSYRSFRGTTQRGGRSWAATCRASPPSRCRRSCVMTTSKKTERVSGYVQLESERVSIEGYEIHMGKTISNSTTEAFAVVEHEKEGTVKDNVIGTYVHDVFHNDALRRALLNQIRKHKKLPPITDTFNSRLQKEESFSKAAAYVREAVDMEKLYHLIDNYKSPEQTQKV